MCARCAWDCPARSRCSIARRWSSRCWRPWRSTARSTSVPSSPARTTSIPTCPRATRFRSTTNRWPSTATSRFQLPGGTKRIGITRVHMEEDAGKSLHDGLPDSSQWTSIDLNRSGVPLIEIVSEPDISSPDEAWEYSDALERNHPVHRRQRLQHGRRLAALRRQYQHSPGRTEEVRHQDRSEERELVPLYPAGAGVRDRAPRTGAAIRRHHHPGDAPVQRGRGPHVRHALQGAGPRLPLLP